MKYWLACSFLAILGSQIAAADDAYRLEPTDRIRLNVTEWSASGGEIRTRLQGEFTVQANGEVQLPLIGPLPAAGRTTKEIAADVGKQIQTRTGLTNALIASVEIAEYRPISVLGDVDHPGQYPFRPGMIALNALALSGGPYRPTELLGLRAGRDLAAAQGDLAGQRAALAGLLLRQARLQAELADRDIFDAPAEVNDDPSALAAERRLLALRRQGFRSEQKARDEIVARIEERITTLREAIQSQNQRVVLLRKDLDEVKGLLGRGLTSGSRQLSAETALADADFRTRDLEAQLAQATQGLVSARQAASGFLTERQTELTGALRDVDRDIQQTRERIATATALAREAGDLARLSAGGGAMTFRLRRGPTEIQVDPATPLTPGDVLTVETARAIPTAQSK